LVRRQGDQIRRIFAFWAIVYFGLFFSGVAQIFSYLFSRYTVIKNVLGYILGNFFTNSSGHSVSAGHLGKCLMVTGPQRGLTSPRVFHTGRSKK
jgi:hypothetical protein